MNRTIKTIKFLSLTGIFVSLFSFSSIYANTAPVAKKNCSVELKIQNDTDGVLYYGTYPNKCVNSINAGEVTQNKIIAAVNTKTIIGSRHYVFCQENQVIGSVTFNYEVSGGAFKKCTATFSDVTYTQHRDGYNFHYPIREFKPLDTEVHDVMTLILGN